MNAPFLGWGAQERLRNVVRSLRERTTKKGPDTFLSALDDGHDRLHFFPDGGAQPVAGLLHPRTVLLADLRDLALLVAAQVQFLEVRDRMGLPVADILPAFVLELLELRRLP